MISVYVTERRVRDDTAGKPVKGCRYRELGEIMCIRVLGGTDRKYGNIGDVIVASVKSATPGVLLKKVKLSAVIVRSKKGIQERWFYIDSMITQLSL